VIDRRIENIQGYCALSCGHKKPADDKSAGQK
jgi:hypothetical protein